MFFQLYVHTQFHSTMWTKLCCLIFAHFQMVNLADGTIAVLNLGESYLHNKTFSICHNVAFDSNTCYSFYPDLTSACRPPRGYEHNLRDNFTVLCDDLTLCCQLSTTNSYHDVSNFAEILNGRNIRNLKSIGCNFTASSNPFITVYGFNKVDIKNPRGVTEMEVRVDDAATQRWLNKLPSESLPTKSELHISKDMFTYSRDFTPAPLIKGYSFLRKETKELVSIAYYGWVQSNTHTEISYCSKWDWCSFTNSLSTRSAGVSRWRIFLVYFNVSWITGFDDLRWPWRFSFLQTRLAIEWFFRAMTGENSSTFSSVF